MDMSSLNISRVPCCCQHSPKDTNAPPPFSSTPPLRWSPDACRSPCSGPIPSQPCTQLVSPGPIQMCSHHLVLPVSTLIDTHQCHQGQTQPGRWGGTLTPQIFTPIIRADPVPMPPLSFAFHHCHPRDVQSGIPWTKWLLPSRLGLLM